MTVAAVVFCSDDGGVQLSASDVVVAAGAAEARSALRAATTSMRPRTRTVVGAVGDVHVAVLLGVVGVDADARHTGFFTAADPAAAWAAVPDAFFDERRPSSWRTGSDGSCEVVADAFMLVACDLDSGETVREYRTRADLGR